MRLRGTPGQGSDRVQAGEIEGGQLGLGLGHLVGDLAQRGGALVRVSAREHDPCARAGQLSRRDQAEAAIGAGDQSNATALIGYLVDRPLVAHPSSVGQSQVPPASMRRRYRQRRMPGFSRRRAPRADRPRGPSLSAGAGDWTPATSAQLVCVAASMAFRSRGASSTAALMIHVDHGLPEHLQVRVDPGHIGGARPCARTGPGPSPGWRRPRSRRPCRRRPREPGSGAPTARSGPGRSRSAAGSAARGRASTGRRRSPRCPLRLDRECRSQRPASSARGPSRRRAGVEPRPAGS